MSWVGIGVAAIGTVKSISQGNQAKKDINQAMEGMPTYAANPEVAKRLGLAKTLYNSDMPGMRAAEQNIYQTQSNQISNAQRGATDASQLLSTSGAIGGQTNKAFTDLSQKNVEDQQRRLGNLTAAQQAQIEEDNKVFQSKMGNYQDMVQLMGKKNQISQQGTTNLTNLGMAGATGINAWYGKGGGGYNKNDSGKTT